MINFANKKFIKVSEVFRYLEKILGWEFEKISAKKDGSEWSILYDGQPSVYKFKEVE